MSDDGVIDVANLPSVMQFAIPGDGDVNSTLAQIEQNHIRRVLAGVEGNKTRAAEILGIDRKTLREKLKQMDNA